MSGGQLILREGKPLTDCSSLDPATPPDKRWVNQLRRRYERAETTVVFDTMPVPSCDPRRVTLERQLQGVTDNPVFTLPVNFYWLGGSHVRGEGPAILSNIVADQLLALPRSVLSGEAR